MHQAQYSLSEYKDRFYFIYVLYAHLGRIAMQANEICLTCCIRECKEWAVYISGQNCLTICEETTQIRILLLPTAKGLFLLHHACM